MKNFRQEGSMWNLFQTKANINTDLKAIVKEVESVRKVCLSSKHNLLDLLQIKSSNAQGRPSEPQAKDSPLFKAGESLLVGEKELRHTVSPLKEVVGLMGGLLTLMANEHARLEGSLQEWLGPDKPLHNLILRDYPGLQKDKDNLRKKQKEQENVDSRYNKERLKREQAQDDAVFAEQHLLKENRLKDELETITRETALAEDRFATTLYTLRSKEKELASNLVETVRSLKTCLGSVLTSLDTTLPVLDRVVRETTRSKQFGEGLEQHLSVRKQTIAVPLQVGLAGLSGKLREEGLFRVSPSMPVMKRVKAALDAGVRKEDLLRKYKDPHIYSSLIKYFLRDLPDPLLCSAFHQDWREAACIEDELERMKAIKVILERIPVANKVNISCLFHFLSQLVDEEFYNKMSIENVIVVLSPNLLWDKEGKPECIDQVYKSMIEHYELIFEDNFITNNSTLALNEDADFLEEDDEENEIPENIVAVNVKMRGQPQRSLKENRRKYYPTTRSNSDSVIKRKSMECLELTEEDTDKVTLASEDHKLAELRHRKCSRQSSRSFDETSHHHSFPYVRTFAEKFTPTPPPPSTPPPTPTDSPLKTPLSSSVETSPSGTPLMRAKHGSMSMMSRIPKMNFNIARRQARSVDPTKISQ